jgi:mannonate dehydratase
MTQAGLPPLTITNVRTILTAPAGIRLVVVKVETSEPGLYGLGCATFTQRALAVATAVDQYLRPFLIGKDPDRIEDTFQTSLVSSYWRNGPVLNNALSGVDMALWDIKGKRANMPVYQLLGGKVRDYVPLYAHADGRDLAEVEEGARAWMEQGYRYVRCQVAVPGQSTYGTSGDMSGTDPRWSASAYTRIVPRLFDYLRLHLGDEIELLHDIHERLPAIQAIGLAKALEPYNLFFLEDAFAPEDIGYFRLMRQQTSTPVAMGELFNNPAEYVPLIQERLIDFIRVHVSQIGGLSTARKLAALCEYFGVRTAWHGPGDVSPVGHAANMHLDLACYNFGIQEQTYFSDAEREVFPGAPDIHDGAMWPSDRPGLGVDVDEARAAQYPFPPEPDNGCWPPVRQPDGTCVRP